MRKLSSFKQLRLYRNKEFFLDAPDPQKPRVGIELVVMKENRDDMIRILNDKTFNMRYFKSLYTEKFMRMNLLAGGMKTVKQNSNLVYKDIKKAMPYISYTFLSTKQYANKNLIYDASVRLGLLNHPMLKAPIKYLKQAYVSFDTIHLDARFSSWKKKYYVFEIDSYMKPSENYYLKTNIHSIPQVFMFRLMKDPETFLDYVGSTFIFVNQTGIFTYFELTQEQIQPGSKENLELVSKLKRWLKIMYAYNVSDVDEIRDAENEFEPDEPEKSEDPVESKLAKVAKKFVKNNNVVSSAIKSGLLELSDEVNKVDDTIEDYTKSTREVDEPDSSDDDLSEIIERNRRLISDEIKERQKEIDEDDLENAGDSDLKALDELDKNLDGFDLGDDFPDIGANNQPTARKVVKVVKRAQVSNHTEKELKRIRLLESKFNSIKMTSDGDDFEKLLQDFEKIQIDQTDLHGNGIDQSIKHATNQDVTRQYEKRMLDATIASVVKKFADNGEIKMICTSAKKEDISDNLNAMWKYTFKFEDEFGKKHIIKYQIPKLIENKFFLINGNKKMLDSQITAIPVLKVAPNRVNISTAHNIMVLSRFHKAFDPKIEAMKKFLDKKVPGNGGSYGIQIKLGNSTLINSDYDTTLEYDAYSTSYYSIVIGKPGQKKSVSFMFNQNDIRTLIEELGIAYVEKPGLLPIAVTGEKEIICIDINTGKDEKTGTKTISDMLTDYIREISDFEDVDSVMKSITVPKKYMYTRMEYINRNIAFGVFLGYLYGLEPLMKSMGVKYEFTQERKKYDGQSDQYQQNVIKFADGYLYYDIHPLRHSLILNGIASEMNCEQYSFADMNEQTPYLDTFDEIFRTRQMAKGYIAAKEFMMDPISVEVMKYLNLPYEFLPVMLYANSLLEDNSKSDPKQMQVNRIRKLEIIPVMMYKSMRDAFMQYRNRQNSKNAQMSVKENDVLKRILESGICNDYDTLNPIREVESEGTLTWKGPGGCHVDDAYTLKRRAYVDSMVGVISASSPDSGSVGITRYMSMNPRITNLLGFVKTGDDADAKDIGFGNMGSVAELTTPFAIDHDDPKRLGFVTKESKHLMPAYDTDPLLIGNGVEKEFPYMVSDDFIATAKNDGKVLFVDKQMGLAIVEYKDGSKETIDIKDREHRDGGNSMYIAAKKEFPYKVGDKFKKFDVLARNPSYFSVANGANAPEYNPGVLSSVAIVMSYATYEDSSMITERIAKKLSAEVILPKQIVIGAKANVMSCVKVGDTFQTGDPLMIFEDELDNEEIAQVLAANAQSTGMEGLEDIIKHTPRAKCSGVVHDIKVFYTVPYDEMSDSVRKIVKAHDDAIRARKKKIAEFGASNPNEIITDHIGISKPNSVDKLNGCICPVGKVLIEIYQKYTDYPGSGDKIVFYASMKTTIHRQVPQDLAPYPLGHPERPVDALLSPISVNARMVTSILYALYGNKLVWGLKEKIRGIYDKYAGAEQGKQVQSESYALPENADDISLEATLALLQQKLKDESLVK